MRIPKYRAYIKKLGWMVPVERINIDCQTVEVDLTEGNGDTAEYDFDEIELMQYTGLTDKKGKEIYEGDIVRHNGKMHSVMEFIDEDAGFRLINKTAPKMYPSKEFFSHHVEIVGNIYENPELIF